MKVSKLAVVWAVFMEISSCSMENSQTVLFKQPDSVTAAAREDTTTVFYASTAMLKNTVIPDSVFGMVHLKELVITGMDCDFRVTDGHGKDITQCWMLREIPPQIKKLRKLETLRLTLHAIDTIPAEIGALQRLRIVDLTDNSGIRDINNLLELKNLEELYLSGCNLNHVPKDIGRLPKLKYLGLTGNPLTREQVERIKQTLPNCAVIF